MKRLGSPLILLIVLFKLEGRAADYRSLPARNDLHDVEEPLTKDNPHMDMEYWSHQQVLDFDHHTTAVTTTAEESLIPTLRKEVNSSIVTSAGQTVYLHCLVENLGERSVTWIRRSDLKLLTIGKILYTQDQRFLPIHDDGSDVWILKLTNTQVKDSGEYECQVSYHEDVEKKLTMSISLKVLDSRAYLHASRDLHVQTGSKLTLSCAVQRSSGHPDYVYWYRNDDVLNYSPHVQILDAQMPEEKPLVSKLFVDNVQKSHSGNYTCAPSNAKPASVLVHVVDDESGPAAMQHGNGGQNIWFTKVLMLYCGLVILVSTT